MTHSDDDFRPRRLEEAGGGRPESEKEHRKKFAKAIAKAEFGRFYWREYPKEGLNSRPPQPGGKNTGPEAVRPRGVKAKVRQK